MKGVEMHIDRRRLLFGISAVLGSALSAGAATALDAALKYTPTGEFQILNSRQVVMLRAIMDTIIPTTETTNASGAGVDFYIDHMMAKVLSTDKNQAITDFLATFSAKYASFPEKDAATQYQILNAVDKNMHASGAFFSNYRAMKELVFIGYYTSEIGARQELAYDPFPGPFQNGPTTEYDRTWST
jgi:hypothetical protein